jgi:hypothetical protein
VGFIFEAPLSTAVSLSVHPQNRHPESLWENQRNGKLCAGAGAHSRSLGCARDDKWRVVTFIRGREIGWTEKKHTLPLVEP